jgi:hypothetical protein
MKAAGLSVRRDRQVFFQQAGILLAGFFHHY